jgi:beta-lactamase class A
MVKDYFDKLLVKQIKIYKLGIYFLIIILVLLVWWIFFGMNNFHIISGKYPLLDPAREYVAPDNYITNLESLREYLHALEVQYPDSISIYYEQINSGSNISVNKNTRLFPASLSKLVQAILITKKVEDGILKWDKELPVLSSDISTDSGTLYQRIGDKPVTVESLLEELLVNSDNTAQNVFKHYLGFDDYVGFQQTVGLEDLYNEQGFISAKEYTRILRVLYTSNFLKSENSQKILEYMSKASFSDYLSKGVPESIKFAHKYGENKDYHLFADSGIVYIPNKPYMLTVLIKGKDSSPETRIWAIGLMKDVSERAYNVSK